MVRVSKVWVGMVLAAVLLLFVMVKFLFALLIIPQIRWNAGSDGKDAHTVSLTSGIVVFVCP